MTAYSNAVNSYIERFRAEVRNDGLVDPREVAEWAYKNGLHKPNLKSVIDAIAADIAQVFREEYRTAGDGRRYRAKHATIKKNGSKTLSLWADLDDPVAPHGHFVESFGQRRQQIVGDCYQLKTDADVYNEHRKPIDPIQIVLDFGVDVEELEQQFQRKAA